MKILDRYILLSFLAVFVGSLLAISFLFTVLSVLDSISYLMGREGATFGAIIHYYLLQLPQTIYMSSPVACLLSSMISLGNMNQHNELLALRAAGVSIMRTALPMAAASLVIAAGLFALGNSLVPVGNRYLLSQKQNLQANTLGPGEKVWYVSESKGRLPVILRIGKVDRETGDLTDLTVFRTGENFSLEEQIVAGSATYDPARGWLLKNAVIRKFRGTDPMEIANVNQTVLDLPDTPDDLLRAQRAPEEMTLAQLNDHIQRVTKHGMSDTAFRVERHTRFAIPLAAVILVLTGTPLAIRPVRSSGLAWGILGAIVIGFGYYVIIAEFIALGKAELMKPWVSAWAANAIFGIIGAISFSRMRR